MSTQPPPGPAPDATATPPSVIVEPTTDAAAKPPVGIPVKDDVPAWGKDLIAGLNALSDRFAKSEESRNAKETKAADRKQRRTTYIGNVRKERTARAAAKRKSSGKLRLFRED